MELNLDILIVDDSLTQLESLKYILEQHNCNVTAVRSGKQALKKLEHVKPDLVISDIIMPEMDGYELCKSIKENKELKDIPVILLTALSDPRDIIMGMEAGADNFFNKPIDEDYIISRIHSISINKHLVKNEKTHAQMGIEIFFGGKKHFINSNRLQMLNLLLSTFDNAVQVNRKLIESQVELKNLNLHLGEIVEEKTQELKRSEECFRQFFENTPIFCYQITVDGKIININGSAIKTLGYHKEELIGKSITQIAAPQSISKLNKILDQINEQKAIIKDEEIELLCKDNSLLVALLNMTPIKDKNGKVIYLIITLKDITDRKKTEKQKEFTNEILIKLNSQISKKKMIHEIIVLIKDFWDFDAVAIRLREGADFPYYELCGFPPDFVQKETFRKGNSKSDTTTVTSDNEIKRNDHKEKEILECVCETVLSNNTDTNYSFFTKGGSFWINSTSELLVSIKNRKLPILPEECCLTTDYESLALIPVKFNKKIIGLLQINNKNKGKFKLELVHYLESICLSIGLTLGRIQVEEELRQLSTAIEQNPVSILITDNKGNIEYVNPKFTEITGFTYEDVVGKKPSILKTDYYSPTVYKRLWKTIKAGKTWKGEFYNKKKDGTYYWGHSTISPISNDEGKIIRFLDINEDITEKKRLEQQLIQAQKMEVIGTLTGGIAHDFNNLITIIKSFSEFILNSLEKKNEFYEDIEEINNAAIRAASLTRQLLVFSHKQVVKKNILNINNLIENLEKMLIRILGENINLTTELATDMQQIMADYGQIEQVIMNLVVNSHDAMPGGGTLIIKTSIQEFDKDSYQAATDLKSGRYVCLTVEDTGEGIKEEFINKIFDPFFTTKKIGKGTGLGLSVIYSIIKQHNGTINVDSIPGKGTCFNVYFPIHIETNLQKEDETGLQKEYQGNGEGILIIEDDEVIRRFIVKKLSSKGFLVFEASNKTEAYRIFEKKEDKIDLIFSDVILPDCTGLEIVDKLIIKKPNLKILFSSGYTNNKVELEMILEKGYSFIQKPYTLTTILEEFYKLFV